jgi:hypothetical protein
MFSGSMANRKAFFDCLTETLGEIRRLRQVEANHPYWPMIQRQLEAIQQWTANSREPTIEERSSIQIGVLVERELEPPDNEDLADLNKRLKAVNLYFQIWPPDGVDPENMPEDEFLARLYEITNSGGPMRTAKQVRRAGWMQLLAGLILVGTMGTITFNLAPRLLRVGEGGERFKGTPQHGLLVLGLFGFVIVLGLTGVVSGLWQIKTGRPTKWMLYFCFVIIFVLLGWLVRNALTR